MYEGGPTRQVCLAVSMARAAIDSFGMASPTKIVELKDPHGPESDKEILNQYMSMNVAHDAQAAWGCNMSDEEAAWAVMNMVVVKGLPKNFTQLLLLEELWATGFQAGIDYYDALLMTDPATGLCSGALYVSLTCTEAKSRFISTFEGKSVRRFSTFRYTVMPSTFEDLNLIFEHNARLSQWDQSSQQAESVQSLDSQEHSEQSTEASAMSPKTLGRADKSRCNFCPYCGVKAGDGFNFCVQCGSCLRTELCAGLAWEPEVSAKPALKSCLKTADSAPGKVKSVRISRPPGL